MKLLIHFNKCSVFEDNENCFILEYNINKLENYYQIINTQCSLACFNRKALNKRRVIWRATQDAIDECDCIVMNRTLM